MWACVSAVLSGVTVEFHISRAIYTLPAGAVNDAVIYETVQPSDLIYCGSPISVEDPVLSGQVSGSKLQIAV
jgi:hypothetical protein